MDARGERSIPSWAVLLLLVAVSIGVHASILSCTFFSDDFQVLWRIRSGEGSSFFRPLADLSLRANLLLSGPDPWAFRVVNLALLGLNGWLVYSLARRLLTSDAALGAGLFFVLYPFHLEPQAWIIGRGISMASAFTLGALVVATGNAPTTKRTIAVALLVLLGSLCYESALLAPLLLGAWWLILRPTDAKAWRAMLLASIAVVVLNLALRWMVLGGLANDYGAAFFVKPVGDYLSAAFKVIGRSFLPPHDDPAVQTVRFALLGLALTLVGLWFWRSNRFHPERLRAAALVASLYGIASIIAMVGGVSTRTSESDRFLFMPSAFLCVLVALAMEGMRSKAVWRMALVMLVASWSLLLRQGLGHWRTASDTIERIIADTPEPPRGGRLLVLNLPGDHRGAYIFRHGFPEALQLSGRGAADVALVREDLSQAVVTYDGDTLVVRETDVRYDASEALKPKP
ncbi:MAG: hypothetical protein QY325_12340 [Flavobacteriales bacterium]|jgi:hypothetical protein|nr:MAG: hypothetical protein QY325_12340 [Flavobacteriales bacterium]